MAVGSQSPWRQDRWRILLAVTGRDQLDPTRGGAPRFMLWLLFAALLQGAPVLAEGGGRQPFSKEERARLASGQLVTRPVREQKQALRLLGGSAWQIIDAPPEGVFRALLETQYYPRLLPTVSNAVLVSKHPELRRVRIEHKKGPLGISYRMALRIDRERRDISFKLNDPLDSGVRAAWGFLTVHRHGTDQTLLAYGVMADPGDGLLVGLVRGVIHEWLLRVPAEVRKFVEGPTGRARFGARAAAPLASGS